MELKYAGKEGSIMEYVIYGLIFAASMFFVNQLPVEFIYKVLIGGAVGGLLAFLRAPIGKLISSMRKAKN